MKKLFLILFLFYATVDFSAAVEPKMKETFAEKKTSCQLITSREAMVRAKAQADGKVVSVKLRRKGNNSVYLVRMLVAEKRIKNFKIKACR